MVKGLSPIRAQNPIGGVLRLIFSADPNAAPGYTTLVTMNANKDYTGRVLTTLYFTSWNYNDFVPTILDRIPYIIHPGILQEEFATDALQKIVYECRFCKFFI